MLAEREARNWEGKRKICIEIKFSVCYTLSTMLSALHALSHSIFIKIKVETIICILQMRKREVK